MVLSSPASSSGSSPADLLESLLGESRHLREDIRLRERRQRRTNLLLASGVAVTLVMLVALLILILQGRQRSADTRALIRTGNQTAEQIADCTSTGGVCYQQGRQRSSDAVAELIRADVIIAGCAKSTATLQEYHLCIQDGLARPGTVVKTPPTGPRPSPSPTH